MNLITIRAPEGATSSVLTAVSAFVAPDQIEVFTPKSLPADVPDANTADAALAQQIADTIRPSGKQLMRKKALQMALLGWDTFQDQKGEGDPSLRNTMGALSKALRPFFPHDPSPIERISSRRKIFANEGNYLGTRYAPTTLGMCIRDILQRDGVI